MARTASAAVEDLTTDDNDIDVDEVEGVGATAPVLPLPPGAPVAGAGSAAAASTSSAAASSLASFPPPPAPKRQRSTIAGGAVTIERLDLPGGVLDDSILARVAAIAQQLNCVGCDGRGLAAGVADKLPYGCSYRDRRRMPPANKFAVPEHRSKPGTIDVRRPPGGGVAPGRPLVINLFAQWEMGAPGKYNRVQPCPPSDSAATRTQWFRQCLAAIGALDPPLPSIAFPCEIGCGLAGGDWRAYEAMIVEFATAHPETHVTIARWVGGGGGGGDDDGGSGSGRGGGGSGRGGRGGGRGGGGGGGRGGNCFKCGQPGHWSNACPRAL